MNSKLKRKTPVGQPRLVRRGLVETTTGMIRVKVYVQQDTEDRWIAKVSGSSPISYAGQTRKEAIRLALEGASIPPNTTDQERKSPA